MPHEPEPPATTTHPLMNTLFRTLSGTALLALAASISGCVNTDPGVKNSHWNIDSVDNRVVKQFTGYKGPVEGTFWGDHLTKYRKARRLTLRRHFLNNNPHNPFEPEDPSISRPRKDFGDPPSVKEFEVKNK